MDIRIGIAQSGQVIEIEASEDTDPETLKTQIDKVLAGEQSVLWLSDRRGRQTGLAAAQIAFVELGETDAERKIGFGA